MEKTGIKNISILFSFITILFTLYIVFFESIFLDVILFERLILADTSLIESLMAYMPDITENSSSFIGSSELLLILAVAVSVILFSKKQISMLLLFYVITSGSVILTFLMKISIARERPGEILYFDLFGLTGDLVSYSYPSGHVVKSGVFILFIAFLLHVFIKNVVVKYTMWSLMVLSVGFVGTVQLIRGRHFPSDIVGGCLVMITWFFISLSITEYLYNRFDFLKKDGDLLDDYFSNYSIV